MKIHLLEHDPIDLTNTNITTWARKRGYSLTRTYVCNNEKLPSIDDFDWFVGVEEDPKIAEDGILITLPI